MHFRPYVVSTILLLLINFACASNTQDGEGLTTVITSRTEVPNSCPVIKGNPDFYGLGIRIGIYLQWFSSWISNTVNPSAAATNHDANTIFLIAVLSALAVALPDRSVTLVEKYIMLLLSSGFVFSVLSILGLRLHLLQPVTLNLFRKGWHESQKQKQKAKQKGRNKRRPGRKLVELSFQAASGMKHPALSWAGVAIRSATASLLSILSIWLWFRHATLRSSDNNGDTCNDTLFFFGARKPHGDLLLFFRIAATALSIVPFSLFFVSVAFTLKFVVFGELWLARHAAAKYFGNESWKDMDIKDKRALGTYLALMSPKSFFDSLDIGVKSRQLYRRIQAQVSRQPSRATLARTWDNLTEFWATKGQDLPPLSDLLQGYMSLLSRGVDARLAQANSNVEEDDESSMVDRVLSLAAHFAMLATMSCFVLFIEKTITVSRISEVNTLNATGQLVPFIIGIVSTAAAVREIAMLLLRKSYPEWHQFHLALGIGMMGNVVRVVKIK